MSQGSLYIYQNCKSGQFLVLRMFLDRGVNWGSGDFVVFTPEQMRWEGARFAEEHFRLSAREKPVEPTEFETMPAKDQEKFRRSGFQKVFVSN